MKYWCQQRHQQQCNNANDKNNCNNNDDKDNNNVDSKSDDDDSNSDNDDSNSDINVYSDTRETTMSNELEN